MIAVQQGPGGELRRLVSKLNGAWHKRAMQVFAVIVVSHWVEHILQAFQVYALGWPRHDANGALGLFLPGLVHSEWLHYGYALAMLIGLVLLRPGTVGRARVWWDIALVIQTWHYMEHMLLLGQAATHHYLFGGTAPISILQLVIPRIELHLFYNAVVTVPMLVASYLHVCPSETEACTQVCTCHIRKRASAAQ